MATANVKISELPSLSTMTGVAQIPVVAGGVTYQITGANLTNYFTGSYGNTNVVANLAALGTNPISTTGNITGGNLDAVNLVINNIRSDDSSFVNIEDGVNITGAVVASGNITGNYFIGNGSQLTGISAGANTGNVTFSGEIVIGTGTSNLISGLYLAPSSSSANANMYLRVRGNINDEPTHIHFDTGNNAYYNQFIGDDNKYIQLANTGNIIINSNNGVGNSAQWIFAAAGKITLPNGASLNDTSGDSVAFGQNAGLTSQAQHAVAIGINAGSLYQGEDSVAIGYNAGYQDQGRGVAIGWNAGRGGTLYKSVNTFNGGSGPVTTYDPVQAPNPSRLYVASTANIVTSQRVFGNNIQANTVVTAVYVGEDRVDITPNYTAAMSSGDTLTFVGLDLGLDNATNVVQGMRVTGNNLPANTFVQNVGCSVVTLSQYPTAPLSEPDTITFSVGQGFGATAVGYQAGSTFQGDDAVAVGRQAGYASQNDKSVAVGGYAGYNVQGNAAVAVGYNAGQGTQGINAVAVGVNAGYNTQGNTAVAIGAYAGNTSQGNAAVAIGRNAGNTSQGLSSIAIGENAGYTNQANNSIILNATGANLNQTTANTFTVAPVRNDVANTGQVVFYNTTSKEITYGNVISVAGNITGGNLSAVNLVINSISSDDSTFVTIEDGVNISSGAISSQENLSLTANAYTWTFRNDGIGIVLPYSATIRDTNNGALAIGFQAGFLPQGTGALAIGYQAALTAQGAGAVAIGRSAGNSQSDFAVAIGSYAGVTNQGNAAVAVGKEAGNISQGINAVAIGTGAGYQGQGLQAVAIGASAGSTSQGINAVAIGTGAGYQGQGLQAVAIGASAGSTSQGVYAIAIGAAAGAAGNSAVAIGVSSGFSNQGNFAVAIGASAGGTNQGNNSIILNATGAALDQTTANTFTVKPVRGDSTSNLVGGGFKAVYYNSTTGEFAYSTD